MKIYSIIPTIKMIEKPWELSEPRPSYLVIAESFRTAWGMVATVNSEVNVDEWETVELGIAHAYQMPCIYQIAPLLWAPGRTTQP